MIAAGEVVERPGSVIKELMENALDAGAKNVTVELRGGGATYIRVTDDGCGMAPEDAGNCFLRHATSKLKDERGLEAISTMGFRGEALAAISAVSRVELVTRRAEDEMGTRVEVLGGEIQDMGPTGCPQGTVFTIRDLFYNTPARLKFMKSDRAEGLHCVQLALRVALGRPDVSVRCIRDGKEEFFTPGDGRAESAVYALLGRDVALSMLPVEGENGGVRVSGFVSSPAKGRGNRAMEFFFVNGRSIKSAVLQAAVEQAYKNTLLVGRFPACVIYVNINPGAVDVNVHPTKNEVKFSSEKKVFDGVHYSAVNAIRGEKRPLEMALSPETEKKLEPVPPARPEIPQQKQRHEAGKPGADYSTRYAIPEKKELPAVELHSPVIRYQAGRPAVAYSPQSSGAGYVITRHGDRASDAVPSESKMDISRCEKPEFVPSAVLPTPASPQREPEHVQETVFQEPEPA
jgi:DNA mismatch repair protein MutL